MACALSVVWVTVKKKEKKEKWVKDRNKFGGKFKGKEEEIEK